MKLPKNGAMTTVSSAVTTRERLAMAHATSPSFGSVRADFTDR